MVKEIQGDLVAMANRGVFEAIVHGCNCMCTMGSGIARQISRVFPAAADADKMTRCADRSKLGRYTLALCRTDAGSNVLVINAYTQFDFGKYAKCYLDYGALRAVTEKIAFDFSKLHIGMPRIGCGLGGGEWKRVKEILESAFFNVNATVVEYKEE